ncbi:hypothetical protein LTR37_009786 [Vermiconidia calcicola]|uniref:Uncharacterized protein n=1 Tax=Vermiconidia calcicola TaxID=1690605 RepID=A0ACC3N700_9PEZI|nr:hypothetical protein LTR37_009786 [Vermiconidia calcicola]
MPPKKKDTVVTFGATPATAEQAESQMASMSLHDLDHGSTEPTPATAAVMESAADNSAASEALIEGRESGSDKPRNIKRFCPKGHSHREKMPGCLDMPARRPIPVLNEDLKLTPLNELDFVKNPDKLRKEHNNLVKDAPGFVPHTYEQSIAAKSKLDYHSIRTNIATLEGGPEVVSNHLKVTIPRGTVLYEYRVVGLPSQTRRAKRRMLIRDMIEHNEELVRFDQESAIATDCFDKVISRIPLHNEVPDDEAEKDIEVLDTTVRHYHPGDGKPFVDIRLKLRFKVAHKLDGLREFVEGTNESYMDTGAAEAINIVIARSISTHADIFQAGKKRFYYRPGWTSLEGAVPESAGLMAIRGYYASIKPAMGSVLLNVNTVTSVFYQPKPLTEYLDRFHIGSNSPSFTLATANANTADSRLWKKCQEHLKGLRVYVDFKRAAENKIPEIDTDSTNEASIDDVSRRVKTLVGLGNNPEHVFMTVDGVEKSVWEHLQDKYENAKVDGGKDYKTGNVGRLDAPKYYLASQLRVLSDQPYRRFPMPSALTERMIDVARRTPAEDCRAIIGEGLKSFGFNSSDKPPMLEKLGITVSESMVRIPCREAQGPGVQYRNYHQPKDTLTPYNKGFWHVPADVIFEETSQGFIKGSKGSSYVQFFCTTDRFEYPSVADKYVENFINLHNANDLDTLQLCNGQPTFQEIRRWDVDSLKEHLEKFGNLGLAVGVFTKSDAETREKYANFKIVVDQHLGLKSICLNEQRMCGSLGGHFGEGAPVLGDRQLTGYMRNIAMKLNLRCGNWNHRLRPADLLPRHSDTIILGADVTHPGGGSLRFTPSIAAVVGSIDQHFARFLGSMRLNTSRKESIEKMQDMVRDLLLLYHAQNKKLPSNVLYYRDGVSDSQYALVRHHEVGAIRKAFVQARAKARIITPAKAINITTVVVTKRHHTRFYPQAMDAKSITKSGNCLPGTVVDAGITSPYYSDFFLLSQNVPEKNYATARPAHYFVLENGMKLTPRDLQDFTFNLCHTYGRSNTAVSYAPPAYYADRLCERGRLYLQPLQDKAKEYKGLSEEELMEKAKAIFYKRRTLDEEKNPWHENHDRTMFWM